MEAGYHGLFLLWPTLVSRAPGPLTFQFLKCSMLALATVPVCVVFSACETLLTLSSTISFPEKTSALNIVVNSHWLLNSSLFLFTLWMVNSKFMLVFAHECILGSVADAK